jgi:uncharacterized protein YlxW (UPF0749 family)
MKTFKIIMNKLKVKGAKLIIIKRKILRRSSYIKNLIGKLTVNNGIISLTIKIHNILITRITIIIMIINTPTNVDLKC